MGKTQRKINGIWIDEEAFERIAKSDDEGVSDLDDTVAKLNPMRVHNEAVEALESGDYAEMGSFLATYAPGSVPRSKDDRISALDAFISEYE